MTLPGYIKPRPDGVLLSVRVQPRAARNEMGQPLGDELRVKVTAPPVQSAANEAVVELLAKTLRIKRGGVELVRGRTSRHKAFKIRGLKPEDVIGLLKEGPPLPDKDSAPAARGKRGTRRMP